MQKYANPTRFLKIQRMVQPWLALAAGVTLAAGLYLALVTAPPDYQQGETVRIMFVHVPAAWLSLFCYVLMAVASAVGLIYRHPLAAAAAKTAAPIGAAFTFLALATGALWGQPMWGTWWQWGDARLTSMFVLLLLYLGYIAVWQAIDDQHKAARIAAIVAIAGVINVPIVKFSVDWWATLHQPASVFRMDGPAIHVSLLIPLLVMAAGYTLLFIALHLLAIRSEITARRALAMEQARVSQV